MRLHVQNDNERGSEVRIQPRPLHRSIDPSLVGASDTHAQPSTGALATPAQMSLAHSMAEEQHRGEPNKRPHKRQHNAHDYAAKSDGEASRLPARPPVGKNTSHKQERSFRLITRGGAQVRGRGMQDTPKHEGQQSARKVDHRWFKSGENYFLDYRQIFITMP